MPLSRLTPAQAAAYAREDALLDVTYPGEYVAFIDTFNGDELTRRVLAHAPDSEGFHTQMAAVDPELAMRADMTRTPEPTLNWLPLRAGDCAPSRLCYTEDAPHAPNRSLAMPPVDLTDAQYDALDREDAVIQTAYPGEYVAFIDTWNGAVVTRRVLAHAPDCETFHAQMAALDPELAARVEMFRTPDPNDTVWIPARTA